MFAQGQFLIDPNAPPEEIVRKRAALNKVMRAYGRANNIGEGVGDLLTGIGQGVQNRRVTQAERAQTESANNAFDSLFGGGEPAAPTIDSGGFPSAPSSPGFPPAPSAPSGTLTPPADIPFAYDGDLKSGINATAEALGIDPIDLATAISYETAGTFDPTKRGPTTQWGQHRGLIQFGEPQAQKYGVNWDDPVGSQLGPEGAVANYLRDTGVKPGMGLLDIYSAINAGGVGRYNRSDANNGGAPGTVRDKVEQQMAGHRAKALAMFGGSQPQNATQAVNAMAGQQTSQEPIIDPMAYNEQVVRQSTDLAGEPMPVERAPLPMRQPTPQAQPPIPGIQATAPSMQDMVGRMPAPEGQPMAQGRDALAAALMQQQAAPQAQQAIEQAAPQEVDPRAQFNSPQLNAADPTQGILKVLMERGGQPAQANPAVSRVQQAMQGQGGQQNIGKLIELANNPFLSEGKRAVIASMVERTMKAQDPAAQLDLEMKQLQLEQMRNPQANPPAGFQELQMRAEAAGLKPGTPEYSAFMENGGGVPATFRALDMQAQAAGFQKGTPEYNEFMATRGAGLQAGAKTTAENLADLATGGAAEGAKDLGKASIAAGTAAWEGYGKIQTNLSNIDEAIAAIDRGANSGLVYNMLPSVTEASASLTNAMNRMGLDVIGSVTFGALSEGEMRLAMETAVPQGLGPPELRQWLVRKRDAQQKAAAMMANAAQFLTIPGNTLNDWIAKNKAEKQKQSSADPASPAAQKTISEMTDEELEALANGD